MARIGLLLLLIGLARQPILGAAEVSGDFAARAREHWAFQPLRRPTPPEVARPAWCRNPLDQFILAGLERNGIDPAAPATPEQLLRRLTFDLIGLPPTPVQREAFLAARPADAEARLVDALLASPHYGERWGRHWLDLARFAESDGFEHDALRTNSWRYRDYVISSFNSDKPYDQFVREQVAGDELAPDDPEARVATGFNLLGPDMVDSADQVQRRLNTLNDMTDTTAAVFLGLTLGCARCHDHKFEPISQQDYYAFQAFYTPARFHRDWVVAPTKPTALPAPSLPLTPSPNISNDAASSSAGDAKKRPGPKAPTNLPTALALADGVPTNTYLLARGDYTRTGQVVTANTPAILPPLSATPDPRSPRRSLADWLASTNNPLTARVLANRIWQHHFGRGLVASPSGFGLSGQPPSHPELLDWLASELAASGWSMKHLHRLILNSATYQQSSRASPGALAQDPGNQFYSRRQRIRIEGELFRDSLLAVAGDLNPVMGGPSVFPPVPPEMVKSSGNWPRTSSAGDKKRRSLYIFAQRNLRFPFLEVFDAPDSNLSCPARTTSTTAPQALALLNASTVLDAARTTSERVARETESPGPQIDLLFRECLGRAPTALERQQCLQFREESSLLELCRALFNLNAFAYVD